MHNKRDKHADREADKEKEDAKERPPTGSLGPGGTVIDKMQGESGAIEPDPPEDKG